MPRHSYNLKNSVCEEDQHPFMYGDCFRFVMLCLISLVEVNSWSEVRPRDHCLYSKFGRVVQEDMACTPKIVAHPKYYRASNDSQCS